MAGYWLKVYTETINDYKYHLLSDAGKLGIYEALIVAKDYDLDGVLPSVQELAFRTRRTVEWWQSVLDELHSIEFVVTNNDGDLVIRKFSERQAAITGAQRYTEHRKRSHKKEFDTVSETQTNRLQTQTNRCDIQTNRDGDIEIEKEIEKEIDKSGASAAPLQDEMIDYVAITGHKPRRNQVDAVITAMQAITRKDRRDYLQQFWAEWSSRGYNPYGLAWLTEWAHTGIPARKNARAEPDLTDNTRFLRGQYADVGEC